MAHRVQCGVRMIHRARALTLLAVLLATGCTDDAVTVPEGADDAEWGDIGFAAAAGDQWCFLPGICTIADEVGHQIGNLATTGVYNDPAAGKITGFAIHNATDSEQLAMIQYKECNGDEWASEGILLGADQVWAAHVHEVVGAPGPCGGGTLRLWLVDDGLAVLGHAFVSYSTDGGASYQVFAPATGQTFPWP